MVGRRPGESARRSRPPDERLLTRALAGFGRARTQSMNIALDSITLRAAEGGGVENATDTSPAGRSRRARPAAGGQGSGCRPTEDLGDHPRYDRRSRRADGWPCRAGRPGLPRPRYLERHPSSSARPAGAEPSPGRGSARSSAALRSTRGIATGTGRRARASTTSTQSAPAETTPAQTTPAQAAPAQTTPAQTTPAQAAPAQTTPAQTTPPQTTPASGSGSGLAQPSQAPAQTPAAPVAVSGGS